MCQIELCVERESRVWRKKNNGKNLDAPAKFKLLSPTWYLEGPCEVVKREKNKEVGKKHNVRWYTMATIKRGERERGHRPFPKTWYTWCTIEFRIHIKSWAATTKITFQKQKRRRRKRKKEKRRGSEKWELLADYSLVWTESTTNKKTREWNPTTTTLKGCYERFCF